MQAAFYYAAACAPKGTTAFGKAAAVIVEVAKRSDFYMVNRGAFTKAEEADAAAKEIVGTKGSVTGPLGLEVLAVKGETKSASEADALPVMKGLVGVSDPNACCVSCKHALTSSRVVGCVAGSILGVFGCVFCILTSQCCRVPILEMFTAAVLRCEIAGRFVCISASGHLCRSAGDLALG